MAEGFPKSFCQRVKVNIFDGHFKGDIPVVAAAPFGLTDINPVGCLVTDALEAVTFHKGFQQIKGMVVFLYPVRADTPGDSSQDMAVQVRHSDPGQNQKPHVIGQKFEIALFCLRIPANKVIPGSTVPGCRAKEKTNQWIMSPVKNQIFHVLSHSTAKTQIMVSGKQALEDLQKAGAVNQWDMYRFKGAQGTGNRSSVMWHVGNRDLATAPAGSLTSGQGDMATLL